MSVTAFAASNPADDVSTYSYNTGRQAYEARMAEKPAWFDNEDETTTANYSFHAGNQAAEARIEAFKAMHTGENLTDEELAAFFEKYGIGEGSAYKDGVYDETAKASYGYIKGQTASQERQASFQNWSAFSTLFNTFGGPAVKSRAIFRFSPAGYAKDSF